MKHNVERGFIALISAIIISAILLLVIAAMGTTSFFSRFNALDAELKERSSAAADACADRALAQLAFDPGYTGGVYSLNALDQCRVGKVSTIGGTYHFQVQATSSGTAVTDLQVVANSADLSVISWQEIPTY